MSVRKRVWTTSKGERKEAWIVDYIDQGGDRHIETFARKKDADAYEASVRVEVSQGIHTPPARSITVETAAADWLRWVELENRERATIAGYRVFVNKHIVPRLGATKLAALTTPRVQKFRDDLLADQRADRPDGREHPAPLEAREPAGRSRLRHRRRKASGTQQHPHAHLDPDAGQGGSRRR